MYRPKLKRVLIGGRIVSPGMGPIAADSHRILADLWGSYLRQRKDETCFLHKKGDTFRPGLLVAGYDQSGGLNTAQACWSRHCRRPTCCRLKQTWRSVRQSAGEIAGSQLVFGRRNLLVSLRSQIRAAARTLRRSAPARPSTPVPRRVRLPGSGTVDTLIVVVPFSCDRQMRSSSKLNLNSWLVTPLNGTPSVTPENWPNRS